ncbi:MAG: hypothetical protein RR325_04540 [Bacilli bacterium]
MNVNNIMESLKKYSILKEEESCKVNTKGEGISFSSILLEASIIRSNIWNIGDSNDFIYQEQIIEYRILYKYLIMIFEEYIKEEKIEKDSAYYICLIKKLSMGMYLHFVNFINKTSLKQFSEDKSSKEIKDFLVFPYDYVEKLGLMKDKEELNLKIIQGLSLLQQESEEVNEKLVACDLVALQLVKRKEEELTLKK